MRQDEQTYLEQINKYYNRKLKSYELIQIGITPEVFVKYGAERLPLVMQQSTLTKCIRKQTGSRSAHNLPRSVIETLQKQLENPIFLIQDKERQSMVIISDAKDRDNNNILIAVKLGETQNAIKVNSIKSIYGKTNIKEYFFKHFEKQQLHIIDNKKAEILSRVIGLQLPEASINLSYSKNLSYENENVNDKNSLIDSDGKL